MAASGFSGAHQASVSPSQGGSLLLSCLCHFPTWSLPAAMPLQRWGCPTCRGWRIRRRTATPLIVGDWTGGGQALSQREGTGLPQHCSESGGTSEESTHCLSAVLHTCMPACTLFHASPLLQHYKRIGMPCEAVYTTKTHLSLFISILSHLLRDTVTCHATSPPLPGTLWACPLPCLCLRQAATDLTPWLPSLRLGLLCHFL